MDTTEISKAVAGGLGLVSVMVLALTGKIDGATAMQGVNWIVGTYLGAAALHGGTKAIAAAMKKS